MDNNATEQHAAYEWLAELPVALERARRERRFVLADFAKDH